MSSGSWYYNQIPEKRAPVAYSKIKSQIPGLQGIPEEQHVETLKTKIKETDSDFVRKSKLGGTKDLFSVEKEYHIVPRPVRHYHKADWYYMENDTTAQPSLASADYEPIRMPPKSESTLPGIFTYVSGDHVNKRNTNGKSEEMGKADPGDQSLEEIDKESSSDKVETRYRRRSKEVFDDTTMSRLLSHDYC